MQWFYHFWYAYVLDKCCLDAFVFLKFYLVHHPVLSYDVLSSKLEWVMNREKVIYLMGKFCWMKTLLSHDWGCLLFLTKNADGCLVNRVRCILHFQVVDYLGNPGCFFSVPYEPSCDVVHKGWYARKMWWGR